MAEPPSLPGMTPTGTWDFALHGIWIAPGGHWTFSTASTSSTTFAGGSGASPIRIPWHVVNYLTGSHDQIYNDPNNTNGFYLTQRFGGRLNGYALAKIRLAWALNATLAGTPMLFMGTEGHIDGFWNPWVGPGIDNRLDWLRIGDNLGAPMQRMVTDVNNLRWNHPALRSSAGQITHTDPINNVVAFKRWNNAGDVILVVVNAGNGQWDKHSVRRRPRRRFWLFGKKSSTPRLPCMAG